MLEIIFQTTYILILSFVLKRFSYVFGPILTAIFEKSHKEGVVSLQMKKSIIVPLFKSGDRCLPENYRPVSLTPIIAKTLESCVYDLLLENVDANNIISEKTTQFPQGSFNQFKSSVFLGRYQ